MHHIAGLLLLLHLDLGPPATVGLNAGDNKTFASVTGSNTNDIINIEQTSNIGVPGIWVFQVNGAEVLGTLSDHDKL